MVVGDKSRTCSRYQAHFGESRTLGSTYELFMRVAVAFLQDKPAKIVEFRALRVFLVESEVSLPPAIS